MSGTEDNDDTIVARATPAGTGGIGIVRVSGALASRIATIMLGRVPPPRVATFSTFSDAHGQPLDQGIALYFPSPQSFTGEDVLELHGHGGPIVVSALVDAAVALGARMAEPGEFSRRAFLNGKLDLAQAEAIADLISSGSTQAARAALRSLSGAFSDAVEQLKETLTSLRIYVEAAIDFPEEEIDFLADDALLARVDDCAAVFQRLRDDARVDKHSGVSQRLPISLLENVVSNAEQRALLLNETRPIARISDLFAALPAVTGKVELEYEGELKGAAVVAREIVTRAIGQTFSRRGSDLEVDDVIAFFAAPSFQEARGACAWEGQTPGCSIIAMAAVAVSAASFVIRFIMLLAIPEPLAPGSHRGRDGPGESWSPGSPGTDGCIIAFSAAL